MNKAGLRIFYKLELIRGSKTTTSLNPIFMTEFKDKHALIGRNKQATKEAEISLGAKPFSRSLQKLRENQVIQCEIRSEGSLILTTANVIGDRIKVTKTNAIKFANWILETYDRSRKAPKLARQSKTSKRVS